MTSVLRLDKAPPSYGLWCSRRSPTQERYEFFSFRHTPLWRVLIAPCYSVHSFLAEAGQMASLSTPLNKWVTPAIGRPWLCTKWSLRYIFVLHKTSTTPLPRPPRRGHADKQCWSRVNEHDPRSVWWEQFPLFSRNVNGVIGGV